MGAREISVKFIYRRFAACDRQGVAGQGLIMQASYTRERATIEHRQIASNILEIRENRSHAMSSSDLPIDQRGYANPELLVSTDWLADHLDDPALRIVDCDFPGGFGRAHIPGAVPVIDNYYKGEDRIHVQSASEFEATMSALGISDGTTVIAYDSDRCHFSPRLFWALQHYGHDSVKILDGGFAKWFEEGRPLEREARQYASGNFTARDPQIGVATINALKQDILAEIGNSETVFWDVRTDEEYSGENARGTARGGRIPGAVHLEWANLITDEVVPVFRPGDELRTVLEGAGVTPDKNVIAY